MEHLAHNPMKYVTLFYGLILYNLIKWMRQDNFTIEEGNEFEICLQSLVLTQTTLTSPTNQAANTFRSYFNVVSPNTNHSNEPKQLMYRKDMSFQY